MNKFWVLTISPKLDIQRTWMNSDMVISFLEENKGSKVYRSGTDQEAEIIYADPINELVWKDVLEKKVC